MSLYFCQCGKPATKGRYDKATCADCERKNQIHFDLANTQKLSAKSKTPNAKYQELYNLTSWLTSH